MRRVNKVPKCISKRCLCVSHKHHYDMSLSIPAEAVYLVCSLNNRANMEPVTEKICSSDGGHGAAALGAAQGINSSHKGITRGTHLHFTLTT